MAHEAALALQKSYMSPDTNSGYLLQKSVFVSSELARNFRACVQAARCAPAHPDELGMVWMEGALACIRGLEASAATGAVPVEVPLDKAVQLLRRALRAYIAGVGEYETLRLDMHATRLGDGVSAEDGAENTYRVLLNTHTRNSTDELAEFERSVDEAQCGASAAAERALHVQRVEALAAARDAQTRERVRARVEGTPEAAAEAPEAPGAPEPRAGAPEAPEAPEALEALEAH